MLLLWEMRWWVMRERNRLCVFFVSPCYGMYGLYAMSLKGEIDLSIFCLCQWICRQVYFNLCEVHVMVGRVSCDLPRMLQPQTKEERVWSSVTLDFHFHHGELANVQTLGCRFPGVVPLHRTGDALHSPGHAAIVGCLDGLLEINNNL